MTAAARRSRVGYGVDRANTRRCRPAPQRGWWDLSRRALEALVAEEYKQGHLTKPDLRRLLGCETSDQIDSFLKAHDVWIDYTVEDLERERAGLRRLGFDAPGRRDTSPIATSFRSVRLSFLPRLFEEIFLSSVVADELRHPSAPPVVRDWMQQLPTWLEVRPVADVDDPRLKRWTVARGQPLRSLSPSTPTSSSLMTAKARPPP